MRSKDDSERQHDETRPHGPESPGLFSRRAALVVFALAAAPAVPLRLDWAREAWFTVDDWDFLAQRTAGNLGDLFRPHYEHWSTLIVLAYRLLWTVAGLHYLPYALFAIALYLAVAALVRVVMRRAGVGPWVATGAALLLVYFGAGVENNFFTGAMAFGLTQLLLADHDGAVDRRDYLGLGAGFAALMCSGLAITMIMVVGITMLLRRSWRIALLHTAPLGAAYLIWLAAAPKGQSAGSLHAHTVGEVVKFVGNGFQEAFGRLGQVSFFGFLLGAILLVGLSVMVVQNGVSVLRGRAAASVALLAGTIVFLLLTGSVRSGVGQGILKGVGPEHARAGRYAYVVAAMALPALALAVEAIIRRWRVLAFFAVALVAVSIPGRLHEFRIEARDFAFATSLNRSLTLSAPRLPVASQLPRDVNVSIFGGGGPPLGWLIDSLPSGRIPAPASLTPDDIATDTLILALHRTVTTRGGTCRALTGSTLRVLQKGDSFTLRNGGARVVYLSDSGGRSQPQRIAAGTVVALAGPLRLRIDPTASHLITPTLLCG